MEYEIEYALEALRRKYDLAIVHAQQEQRTLLEPLKKQVHHLLQEQKVLKQAFERQEESLATLIAQGKKMELVSHQAITPSMLRKGLIGVASLIGALVLILSTIESYNQNQVMKHEERRWLAEQRQTFPIGE